MQDRHRRGAFPAFLLLLLPRPQHSYFRRHPGGTRRDPARPARPGPVKHRGLAEPSGPPRPAPSPEHVLRAPDLHGRSRCVPQSPAGRSARAGAQLTDSLSPARRARAAAGRGAGGVHGPARASRVASPPRPLRPCKRRRSAHAQGRVAAGCCVVRYPGSEGSSKSRSEPCPGITPWALERYPNASRTRQAWCCDHFPGSAPVPNHPLAKTPFAEIQPKPPLTPLHAVSSSPVTDHESEETGTCPPLSS